MPKKCTICKDVKSETVFNRNSQRKDGLQSKCRECSKERSRLYYAQNKEKHRSMVVERNRRAIRENRHNLYQLLVSSSCSDCGISDPVVLEFDHVRGTKRGNVSKLVRGGYSWETVLREIAKCDIVCANCHRVRTSKQFKWYDF